jgi:hypothetical protein
MTDLHRAPRWANLRYGLIVFLLAACAGAGGVAHTPTGAAGASAPAAGPSPSDAPGVVPAPGGSLDPAVRTACLTLGARECERARGMAASVLEPGDPPVRYVQVGPFGCMLGDRCPDTLAARPEGDVVIEFGAGQGISVHVRVAPDGSFVATREPAMGVALEATSPAGITVGPVAYTLGHCGIFSGVDVDGSWWDVVGPVPMDSGEAVNGTPGILTVTDRDHASFTTPAGFAVQLERRDGPKLLPLCQ